MRTLKQAVGWLLLIGLAWGVLSHYGAEFSATLDRAQEELGREQGRAKDRLRGVVNGRVLQAAVKSLAWVLRNGGSPAEICVRAGLITAALVQARDEARYREWRPLEEEFCKKAMGLPVR